MLKIRLVYGRPQTLAFSCRNAGSHRIRKERSNLTQKRDPPPHLVWDLAVVSVSIRRALLFILGTLSPCLIHKNTLISNLGRKIAELELRMVIVLLVWNFEFKPTPPELSSHRAVDMATHHPQQCYVRLGIVGPSESSCSCLVSSSSARDS